MHARLRGLVAVIFSAIVLSANVQAQKCTKTALIELGTVKAVRGDTERYLRFSEDGLVVLRITASVASRIEADYEVDGHVVRYTILRVTRAVVNRSNKRVAKDLSTPLRLSNGEGPFATTCELRGSTLEFASAIYTPVEIDIDEVTLRT